MGSLRCLVRLLNLFRPAGVLQPAVVQGQVGAQDRIADAGLRLALKMIHLNIKRNIISSSGRAGAQAKIGILEIANDENLIESAELLRVHAPHHHAGAGHCDMPEDVPADGGPLTFIDVVDELPVAEFSDRHVVAPFVLYRTILE